MVRMFSGSTPARSRFTYRSTSTRVFPVPADASRTTFRDGSTANCRAARSDVTDIILPAHGRIGARLASMHVVWTRREFTSSDCIDHGDYSLLGRAHDFRAFFRERKKRYNRSEERRVGKECRSRW